MKKQSWKMSPGVNAELRALTTAEIAKLRALRPEFEDGWILRLEGRNSRPWAWAPGHDPTAFARHFAHPWTPNCVWVETWIALREADDQVAVLHTVFEDADADVKERAEWYGLPVCVYRDPWRMQKGDYVDLRRATMIDAFDPRPWIENVYVHHRPDRGSFLASTPILRSENRDAIDRLEAVLRTADRMLRRRDPLFDEYCGELEVALMVDDETEAPMRRVRTRLAARGAWFGEPHFVVLDTQHDFERTRSRAEDTPGLFAETVDRLLGDDLAPVMLLERSRVANDARDAREAIAQYPVSPSLQDLMPATTCASVLASMTWSRLVLPRHYDRRLRL